MLNAPRPSWQSSVVFSGDKTGRAIGYPTLNLDPKTFPHAISPGVYACLVTFNQTTEYLGALYFGPRLVKNETTVVLEVFLLEFDKSVYGQKCHYQVLNFIRKPINFTTLEEMRAQISEDVCQISKLLSHRQNNFI
jgi:riboflavin kinase/FMN adenylyltransferase